MNIRPQVVGRNLNRVDHLWRWLRVLQHTCSAGILLGLFFLFWAVALAVGWLSDPSLALAIAAVFTTLCLITWAFVVLAVLGKTLDRPWLAQMVERGQPKLLDRVNTMVALENARNQPEVAPFYWRIVRQAQWILLEESPAPSLSARRAVFHLLAFLGVLLVTAVVFERLAPWETMSARNKQRQEALPDGPAELALELPPPENVVEEQPFWGEVRITEPGQDLEVTKVDVVPLQIEAAANEPLGPVGWVSALNGLTEQTHALPAPVEPRYAIYQHTWFLDEWGLSDWDVLAYYARAATPSSNTMVSDVYFLQVRPFREDILKMPGGENGQAMQCINQLSALIRQQQHVIRQTHQHAFAPPEEPKLRDQDRNKLADAETDLGEGADHLYAKMTSDLANKSVGDALDHLAQAGDTLQEAGQSLRDGRMNEAQSQERGALADLVAARKAFQRAVSEHPGEFTEATTEETPAAADPRDALQQIAEFRDEDKAARDFVETLQRRQASLADKVNASSATSYPKLGPEQRQIGESLEEFMRQHPRAFRSVEPEAVTAKESMQAAAELLEKKNAKGKPGVQEARKDLETLGNAMQEKSLERQLAQAYQLKEMLDRQIETFGQCQNPGASGGPSGAEVQGAVANTRRTLEQLKQMAEQPPTREAFGPDLRESLSDLKLLSLHWPLSELEKPMSAEATGRAAGQVKEGLQEISRAFEASQPQSLQAAQQAGPFGEPEEGWARGMAQLGSLLTQLEKNRPASRENQVKQGNEALHNLRQAWAESAEGNTTENRILVELEEALQPGEDPPDLETLRRLRDALQAFSVELVSRRDTATDQPEVTAIDLNRVPPAYRGRIEKYFQGLSEK